MNMGRKEKGDGEMKQAGECEGNSEAWNCPDRQAGTERTGVLGELHPRCYSAGQRHSVPASKSHCRWLCTAPHQAVAAALLPLRTELDGSS